MSNSLFNIRFGNWHLQLDRGQWRPRLSFNAYWIGRKPRFAIYCLFGRHFEVKEP